MFIYVHVHVHVHVHVGKLEIGKRKRAVPIQGGHESTPTGAF